jgi:NAD(P)-dependent dehydrogenase (short-subunit alcohol dehydrogenase family)
MTPTVPWWHEQEPRTVVVQGASRGVGLALAEALLEDPGVAQVVALARGAVGSTGLRDLAARHGDRLLSLSMDVTREEDIAAVAARLEAASSPVHGLFNVSGLLHDPATGMGPEKRLEHLDPAHAQRAFAVHALGPALMVKHLLPALRRAPRSVVANLSARVGSIGDNRLGGWYSYRATKAAQNQMTRTLSVELARRSPGTVVVALHPGTVETDLSAPFRGGVAAERLFTPAMSAGHLLAVVRGLTPSDSGRFLAWDGAEIPW